MGGSNMNRVRIAAVAAGMTVAMVVGVLVGGAMSTANADGPLKPAPNVDLARPTLADGTDGAGGVPDWVLDRLAERYGDEVKDAQRGEGDTVQCSIVDGCTVELVDADGEIVKVMHITFTDAGEVDVDEAEASE